MAKPPRGSKPKQKPEPDKEQIERFKETARQLGVDETGKEFLASIKKVAPPKVPLKS